MIFETNTENGYFSIFAIWEFLDIRFDATLRNWGQKLTVYFEMESSKSRSKPGRREIRSVCMPVPAIVLNDRGEHATLPHSRSTGELDMSMGDIDQGHVTLMAGKSLSGVVNSVSEPDSRSAIDIYCSPRTPRRSFHSDTNALQGPLQGQTGMVLDSGETGHTLDPGSRVGSTVSLNSEYTSRSIGLISNDSCDSSHHHSSLIDSSYQKHGVLKRFYSSPEKDEEMLHETSVRRDSKSFNNLQGENESFASFEFSSDSTGTDDQQVPMESVPCQSDICDSLSKKFLNDSDISNEGNLVTAITGDPGLRDGRIRKWLTEITDPSESS